MTWCTIFPFVILRTFKLSITCQPEQLTNNNGHMNKIIISMTSLIFTHMANVEIVFQKITQFEKTLFQLSLYCKMIALITNLNYNLVVFSQVPNCIKRKLLIQKWS